jgi:hypothetical protein
LIILRAQPKPWMRLCLTFLKKECQLILLEYSWGNDFMNNDPTKELF